MDTVSYFWLTAASSRLVLLILTKIFHIPLSGYSINSYFAFLASAIFVQIGGWLSINFVQGCLQALIVAKTLLIQSVEAAIFSSIILIESFSILTILDGFTVLVGVYIVLYSHR